jgi:hypothetical protein
MRAAQGIGLSEETIERERICSPPGTIQLWPKRARPSLAGVSATSVRAPAILPTHEQSCARGRSFRIDAHDENAAPAARRLSVMGWTSAPQGLQAGAEISPKNVTLRQELIDDAVDCRRGNSEYAAARSKNSHADDTSLRIDRALAEVRDVMNVRRRCGDCTAQHFLQRRPIDSRPQPISAHVLGCREMVLARILLRE